MKIKSNAHLFKFRFVAEILHWTVDCTLWES